MYKKTIKILLILIIGILFSTTVFADDSLTIISPNYFNEQNNIYDDIHYLENEYLSFKFCSNQNPKDISFEISNEDKTKKIKVYKDYSNENCYYSNYNLQNLTWEKFNLNINYFVNNKNRNIKRNFVKQKESLLINHVIEKDFSKLNDLELSYYLIVLNNLQDKNHEENKNVYDILKNSRNNENKCWEKNDCSPKITSEILRNLKLAGYTLDSRMLDDGKTYLERNIIENPEEFIETDNNEDYELELKIANDFEEDEEIECELIIDGDDDRTYNFDDNSDYNDLTIMKDIENELSFECDNNMDQIDLITYEKKIEDDEYRDKIDYSIDNDDKKNYNEFRYKIELRHEFTNEEIECDLEVDGNSEFENKKFDIDSDSDDLIIQDYFDDEILLDCTQDFDEIKFDVYANPKNIQQYSNENEIYYKINDKDKESYDFEIDFEYDFSSNEEIICTIKTNNDYEKTVTYDEDDLDSGKIQVRNEEASSAIDFSCSKELEKINLRIYDLFERKQVDEEYTNKESFKYTISSDFSDYICIGKGQECDFETSLNVLNTYDGKNIEESSKIEKFIDSFITKDSDQKYVYDTNQIIDTSKYLYYKNNEELTDFLKFNQNNDGSWGDDEDILYSGWAVLGLQKSSSKSEHLEDGKKWIYYNEPQNGWGSIKKNTIAYIAIKEKLKPYLKITPQNIIKNSTTFEIENPTIYNLKDIKITLSDQINEYTSYKQNLGDLLGQEKIEFNITTSKEIYGSKSGELTITGIDGQNKQIELIKLPITIKGKSPFEFSNTNYALIGNNNLVELDIKSKLDQFSYSCNYINPFNKKEETQTITQNTTNLKIINENQQTGLFNFKINCENKENSLNIPINLNITKANKTISITPQSLMLDSYNDFSLNVQNTGDKIEKISIEIGGNYIGLIEPSENKKTLAVNETREIYFTITDAEFIKELPKQAKGSVIIKTQGNYKEEIPILFGANAKSNEGISWIWYLLIGLIAFTIIGLLVWRRHNILSQNNQQNNNNEFTDEDIEIDENIEL
jgi:hypothetical protein